MRRTAIDSASFMQELIETHDRGIDRIRLVQDHLNTHTPGSFDPVLPPQEACELAQPFELHSTPIQGSWLNMAEIELSALARQCLDRRIGDIETFKKEVTTWIDKRNYAHKTVHWKFTKPDARRTLKRKYPMLQDSFERALAGQELVRHSSEVLPRTPSERCLSFILNREGLC